MNHSNQCTSASGRRHQAHRMPERGGLPSPRVFMPTTQRGSPVLSYSQSSNAQMIERIEQRPREGPGSHRIRAFIFLMLIEDIMHWVLRGIGTSSGDAHHQSDFRPTWRAAAAARPRRLPHPGRFSLPDPTVSGVQPGRGPHRRADAPSAPGATGDQRISGRSRPDGRRLGRSASPPTPQRSRTGGQAGRGRPLPAPARPRRPPPGIALPDRASRGAFSQALRGSPRGTALAQPRAAADPRPSCRSARGSELARRRPKSG
jgi:hypothetical protein